MKKSLIDIPVLLIFMARPRLFSKVFEKVRLARPSKLFLYQDGPRDKKENDHYSIQECRKIASNIDWDCEVFKFFQDKNVGCDPSEFIAQKWMFDHVDYGIILEDDDVPALSFFGFCKELLEKYYHDTRINYISGMNHLGDYCPTDSSYFFSTIGSIWGWATWKRSINLWDEKLTFLSDQDTLSLLKCNLGSRYFKHKLNQWSYHKNTGVEYYESIHSASFYLNSQLTIIPKKNLITNIGISSDSTHSHDSLKKVPYRNRRFFYMKADEINLPLKHPNYILKDIHYDSIVKRKLGTTDTVFKRYAFKFANKIIRLINK